MSKKVLVLGSTGAMGQYLVPYLADMGYRVTAVSLEDEKSYNSNVNCVKGNAKDFDFLNSHRLRCIYRAVIQTDIQRVSKGEFY
jgi:nucleoside-diphosphate-sugar epimerase